MEELWQQLEGGFYPRTESGEETLETQGKEKQQGDENLARKMQLQRHGELWELRASGGFADR